MSQLHHQSLWNTDHFSGSFSFSNKILLVYTLQLALSMRMHSLKKILKELTNTFPKIFNMTIDINGHFLNYYKSVPDGTTFCNYLYLVIIHERSSIITRNGHKLGVQLIQWELCSHLGHWKVLKAISNNHCGQKCEQDNTIFWKYFNICHFCCLC